MPMQQVRLADAISKTDFHSRLRAWLTNTDESVIGDPAVIGVTAWIHVREGDSRYKLHADTRREAVERYLQLVDQYGDDLRWTIVTASGVCRLP